MYELVPANMWGAIAYRLEGRTLNRENPVSNPTAVFLNVLDIVLSSQKELVDNVKIFEPLGNSDHNQIHFDINVKSESKNKKTYKRNFHKGNYKDMRKYLTKLD